MDREIKVEVRDKVATAPPDAVIVCGNSDYTILFQFDEEWDGLEVKTARFKYSTYAGPKQHIDVPFKGNMVEVPILTNAHKVEVGVYAGNLTTTTGAHIRCLPSIRCGAGEKVEPSPDKYDALMELIKGGGGANHTHANKDVLDEFGWNYTKTQPTFGGSTQSHVLATLDDVTSRVNYLRLDLEGQISLIPKFSISVVDALPTTDINYSGIYLLKDGETEGNLYTEYVYIKGKWEKLGSHTADVPTTEEIVDAVIEALPKYEGEVSEV